MSEDQASFVFALLDSKPDRKRRTWKENKLFKAEARKDRGSFVKGSGTEAPRGASGGPPGARSTTQAPFRGRFRGSRPKLSREQMKKVSRCRLCDQKGHWAEDCPNASTSAICWSRTLHEDRRLLLPRLHLGTRESVRGLLQLCGDFRAGSVSGGRGDPGGPMVLPDFGIRKRHFGYWCHAGHHRRVCPQGPGALPRPRRPEDHRDSY